MSEYSYQTVVPIRFRDIDSMGQVNNAVYVTYLEQARRNYFADILDLRLKFVDTVLAHLSMDYCAPIDGENDVVIEMCVSSLGSSSIGMEYEIKDGDTVAATAKTVQVTIDDETGDSRELPEEWRARIEAYKGLAD